MRAVLGILLCALLAACERAPQSVAVHPADRPPATLSDWGLFDVNRKAKLAMHEWYPELVTDGPTSPEYTEEDVLMRNDGTGRFIDVARQSGAMRAADIVNWVKRSV